MSEPLLREGPAIPADPARRMGKTVPMADLAKGANSFTEGQARTRIAGAGFSDVTALTEDGDGIWRARGDREGRTFDFKGQVAFRWYTSDPPPDPRSEAPWRPRP